MTSKPAPNFFKLLVIVLSMSSMVSCTGLFSAPTPTITPTNTATTTPMGIMETAVSVAETELVMTQTAIPKATFPPPTIVPPDALSDGRVSPPPVDRLDYAMATAPKIYTLLPYISKASTYGEYSGCAGTNDFNNFVTYSIPLPMEIVNTAFVSYFQVEKWEFTEAISELVGEYNKPRTSYDVYRISSKDIPAFERLRVILTNESVMSGENDIYVRAELTHIETKENIGHISDFDRFDWELTREMCDNSWWAGILLKK